MAPRNIHGSWSMHFEGRLLYSEVIGPTNTEASFSYLEELKQTLFESSEGIQSPWVILHDGRQWEMSSADAKSANDAITDWCCENSCVLFAIVLSSKMQRFAADIVFKEQSILRFYFDYDEAYQACLDKLTDAQQQK
ncbi:hypothetical protein [Dongshaea marina]|uniref:hypothetical protein n=1 Tax=Dongshaea marina TaxID=2047966 RepID=UPI00131F15C2|nr:hypothetical protein [Dongshaea marina]